MRTRAAIAGVAGFRRGVEAEQQADRREHLTPRFRGVTRSSHHNSGMLAARAAPRWRRSWWEQGCDHRHFPTTAITAAVEREQRLLGEWSVRWTVKPSTAAAQIAANASCCRLQAAA